MKQYKCAFKHCAHQDGKVDQDKAIKIGSRYWHKDCYETSRIVSDIADTYIENISQSVVIGFLKKVINEIVFGKKLEKANLSKAQSNLEAARYLEFCLDYAIKHDIPITHVPGLYYLIDNKRIKDAYKKEQELIKQREIKKQLEESVDETPINTSKEIENPFSTNTNIGFGSIFKGVNNE